MCEMTQTYYSCGCAGHFVVKEPRCRYYPNCNTHHGPDTHLSYPCSAHSGNRGLGSSSRTGGSGSRPGSSGGSRPKVSGRR
jgi:hypothetical protein